MTRLLATLAAVALASCASKPPRAIIPPRAEISRLDVTPVIDAGRATRDAVRSVTDAGNATRETSRRLSDTSQRLTKEIARAESLADATAELTAALASVRALADELAADVSKLHAALSFAEEREKIAIAAEEAARIALANSIIREVPVFTKATWSRNLNQSSGITSMTSRKRVTAIVAATGLKFGFQNSYAETNGNSVITVEAYIEDDGGNVYQAYFGGLPTGTVAVDGTLTLSDPIANLTTVKGKTYYLRVYSSWPSGNAYLNMVVDNANFSGDGRIDSVNRAASGVITPTTNYAYGANMVLGTPVKHNPLPTYGFIGDSIFDLTNTGGFHTGFDDNWTVSAMGREQGRNYPYIRLSLGGSNIGTVIAGGSTRRRRFYAYPDIAIVNLGLNDVRASVAAATIMANLQTLYRELLAGGVKEIWQCTITPDTSAGAQEAIRIALNALIRACPNPLTGIIECADAMETSRDSGVWISGYNAVDNYHPNNTGAAVLRDLLRSTLNLA